MRYSAEINLEFPMRLAIAGFNLESVTFLPDPTSLDDFERLAQRGAGLVQSFSGTNTVPGGFLAGCAEHGVQTVALVYTEAGAAAAASEAAFDTFLAEIIDGVSAVRDQIDGLLLGLHGALVTVGGRTDLDFLAGLRAALGPDLPIGVAFDLHGNLDPGLVGLADVMSAYHESPHVDMGETARRVAGMLIGKLRGEIQPRTVLRKVPVTLPSIFTATRVAPLSDVMAEARRREAETPGLLDCSVVMGFAYADVAQIGVSILATADGDIGVAEAAAAAMAALVWRRREALYPKESVLNPDAGLARARTVAARSDKPVVILEHADRMNDSTYVLRQLLETPGVKAAVPYLWDPAAASTAMTAGVGATVSLPVGGHSSSKAGGAVTLSGTVIWAGEARFAMGGEMGRGRPVDLGPTALVRADGIVVWLISANLSAINLDPFEQFGLDHRDFDIVVLRSKTHFRAIWEREAAEIIIVDTPDWGPARLETLPYEHARAGVFPIT
jgi:microcystin degradation protein MlrC